MVYYVALNGQPVGPLEEEQVHDMLRQGEVNLDDLGWREGEPEWQPIRTVLNIKPRAETPPPVPDADAPLETVAPSAVAAAPARVVTPLRATTAPSRGAGPTGVGGWLLFFCIYTTILAPLYTLLGLLLGPDISGAYIEFPQLRTANQLQTILFLLIGAGGAVAGGMLWSGNPVGRILARRYLLARVVAYSTLALLIVYLLRNLPDYNIAYNLGAATGAIIFEILFFAIWSAYFKKSIRVQNTYGPEPASVKK